MNEMDMQEMGDVNNGTAPAINQRKRDWTPVLIASVSAAVLGGSFQYGFAAGNMANTLSIFKTEFNVTEDFNSLINAGNPLGGLVGALLAGYLADRFGRRWCMMLNLAPMLLGVILMSISYDQYMLLVGRIIVGFATGLGSGLTPMFLSEVAPTGIRGAVGTCHGLLLTIGIFVGMLLSIEQVIGTGNRYGWRLFFAFPAIPALYQTVLLYFFSPESPNWLYFYQRDEQAAKAALTRLRSTPQEAEAEMRVLKEEAGKSSAASVTWGDLFTNPTLRLTLVMGVGLHCAQQLSGVNAVLSYAPRILSQANVSDPVLGTILTGLVNVLTTLAAVPLMDRLGRRTLLLAGLALMAVSYVGVAVAQSCSGGANNGNGTEVEYESPLNGTAPTVTPMPGWNCGGSWTGSVSMVAIFTFIIGFATGTGSIPWLIVGELFTAEARGKASSLCVGANWICYLLTVITFVSINNSLQPYTFFLYVGIVTFFLIFTFLFVPETRKKPVDQINKEIEEQSKKFPPTVF